MYKQHIASATILIVFISDRVLKYYSQNLPLSEGFLFFPGVQFKYSLNPALFFFPAWSFIPRLALIVLIAILGFWIWNLFRISPLSFDGATRRMTGSPLSFDGATRRMTGSDFGFRISRPLFFVLLGGASNVFDRFFYGGVVDYVEISNIARINLADILILLGILFLLRSSTRSHTLSTTKKELGIRN